jgi:hypothetical protein
VKKELFFLSELNAIFWIITFIGALSYSDSDHFKIFSGVAFFISAWIQHRALYLAFPKNKNEAEQGAAANP